MVKRVAKRGSAAVTSLDLGSIAWPGRGLGPGWSAAAARDLAIGLAAILAIAALIHQTGGLPSSYTKPLDFPQFTEAVRQVGLYWLHLNQAPSG